MAQHLTKAPSGLTGAFDLKSLGQQPSAFGDVVQPTAESLDLYTLDKLTVSTNTGSISALGASVTLPVQAGQVWRVKGIGVSVNNAAADICMFSCFITVNGITFQLGMMDNTVTAAAGFNTVASRMFVPPLVLGAGSVIGVTPAIALPANRSHTLTALYDLLPI